MDYNELNKDLKEYAKEKLEKVNAPLKLLTPKKPQSDKDISELLK